MGLLRFKEIKNKDVNKPHTATLVINKSKGKIKATFRVFHILDGNFKVAYIPALNLSGYGKSDENAYDMLKEVLSDYFGSLVSLRKDQLLSELGKYGWTAGFFAKQFTNNTYVDKDGVLKNFELPKDTPIVEKILEVA